MKISHLLTSALLVFAFCALHTDGALAQGCQETAVIPSVQVSGEATIVAAPDQAQIDIGVISQAPASQTAATENAQRSGAVLAALKRVMGSEADIKTISYSLNPDYQYPRDGGQPTIAGYTASNIVQVTTNKLEEVGKAIDTAMQAGANTIHRLQFTLKNRDAVLAQALRQAAIEAKSKAEALAAALGLKILRVLSVSEQGPVAVPIMERMIAKAEAADVQTPIEPGTIEVRATVALTVEVGPQ
jgi:uncharacterized protein YggE